jgi:hypothetical protein
VYEQRLGDLINRIRDVEEVAEEIPRKLDEMRDLGQETEVEREESATSETMFS